MKLNKAINIFQEAKYSNELLLTAKETIFKHETISKDSVSKKIGSEEQQNHDQRLNDRRNSVSVLEPKLFS